MKDEQKKVLQHGDYGYISKRKKKQLMKSLLWVIVIAALVIAGIILTGTRTNILTVVAVILVFPGAKTVINFIMFARYQTGDYEEYQKVASLAQGNSYVLSDLILTGYHEGSMYVPIAVVYGGNIFALVPDQKLDQAKIRDYMKQSVHAAGSEAVPVLYSEFEPFYDFLEKRIGDSTVKKGKKEARIREDLLSRAL